MKIRMKTTARGAAFNADAGDVVDVDGALAADLLNGGYAEAVGVEVETAVAPVAEERAEEPRPRKDPPKHKMRKRST